MNIYDLATTLKKAEENENTLRTIMTITNSTKENVVDNVTLLFENAEPTNKVKIEDLIDRLQSRMSDIRGDYEYAYDEVQSALGYIESMSSELDSICEADGVVDELQELINATDEDDGVADGLEMDSETNEQRCATKTTTINTQP